MRSLHGNSGTHHSANSYVLRACVISILYGNTGDQSTGDLLLVNMSDRPARSLISS